MEQEPVAHLEHILEFDHPPAFSGNHRVPRSFIVYVMF
jgi:hypothetical protein